MVSHTIRRRRVLRGMAAIGGAGLTGSIAGCSGQGGGPTETDSPTATRMATPTETDDDGDGGQAGTITASGATVEATTHATYGEVLADADDTVLYRFEPDGRGASTCYGDCAGTWPPLTVGTDEAPTAGASVSADLGTVERDDGSLQVTADGWPLYYFARDEEPGAARGQEVGNVWFVLRPDGSPLKPTVSTRSVEGVGEILTDADGMSLYRFEDDDAGASTCYGGCAEAWPPLTVDAPEAIVGSVRAELPLGTVERDDGSLQVTADGWPLYYFTRDEAPGETEGQGIDDAWFVLGPDGTVITPEATPSGSGGGGGGY